MNRMIFGKDTKTGLAPACGAIVFGLAFSTLIVVSTHAQLVSQDILTRVFQIRYSTNSGSSFAVDVEGRQYLVTARHVVRGIQPKDRIEIERNNRWQPIEVRVINCHTNSDVVVLIPPFQLSPSVDIMASSAGMVLGQDAFFLGYPYGWNNPASGFSLPFVKRGLVSAWTPNTNGVMTIFLDGHNNPGFSGGPIIFKPPGSGTWRIAGVVIGYPYDRDPVYQHDKATEFSIKANTGIVIGHGIGTVVEAIKTDPRGVEIRTSN